VIPPPKLGKSVEKRAGRRSGSSLVIVFCVIATTLTACGSTKAARGVSLLPDTSATNRTWQWTQACRLGPSTRGACAPAGPNLGSAQLDGDEWNLGASLEDPGSLTMSVNSQGSLTMQGQLSSAPPCTQSTCIAPSANTWVRGYPNVLYGINQCSASTSPPVSPGLRLPMRLSSIPSDLIGTTTYSTQTSHITYDVGYDMWLNNSATKTPCKKDGTLEVMVWTGYDQRALLPDSVKTGTASIPFKVDGTLYPGPGAWSVYVSNVFQRGHTEPWGGTVWFVLNKSNTVHTGTVSVDLSTVFSEVGTLLQNNYGWADFQRNYWLDTVPFGMEFGPESGTLTGAGSSYFSLRLSSYCLGVGTTVSDATCRLDHR
jgi:hypothetical protein